mgnify:CR=1 FL=1
MKRYVNYGDGDRIVFIGRGRNNRAHQLHGREAARLACEQVVETMNWSSYFSEAKRRIEDFIVPKRLAPTVTPRVKRHIHRPCARSTC